MGLAAAQARLDLPRRPRDTKGRLAENEVAETGPIYTEELHDPLKRPFDLSIPLAPGNVNQAGGELREDALET
jgi:hypothetical protein